jgi:hypothetical protein
MFVIRAKPAPRDSICARLTCTNPVLIAWILGMTDFLRVTVSER